MMGDGRLLSAGKRTKKDVFDPSEGRTKTGRTTNKKQNPGSVSSSTIQKHLISASQSVTVPPKVHIKKLDSNNDFFFLDQLTENIPANLWALNEKIEALL